VFTTTFLNYKGRIREENILLSNNVTFSCPKGNHNKDALRLIIGCFILQYIAYIPLWDWIV